jgi:hypothetical protein
MARTAPQTLSANTPITSGIWNDQISDNLNHLLGLEASGVALTDLTAGSELIPNLGNVANVQTMASAGAFTDIDLTLLDGYSDAYDLELSWAVRSNAAGTFDTLFIVLNNNTTSSNYYSQRWGTSDGVTHMTEQADNLIGITAATASPANSYSMGSLIVPNFRSTNMIKHCLPNSLSWSDTTTLRREVTACIFNSSSAITTIRLGLGSGSFSAGSFMKVRFIF